jgi:hypothetical protein
MSTMRCTPERDRLRENRLRGLMSGRKPKRMQPSAFLLHCEASFARSHHELEFQKSKMARHQEAAD